VDLEAVLRLTRRVAITVGQAFVAKRVHQPLLDELIRKWAAGEPFQSRLKRGGSREMRLKKNAYARRSDIT
jgi:hypothetical protein